MFGFEDKFPRIITSSRGFTNNRIVRSDGVLVRVKKCEFFSPTDVYTDGKNTPDSFAEKMKLIGFTEKSWVAAVDNGYMVMVFTK